VLINWADEFQRWAPSMRVVVFDGTAAQRAQLAKEVIEPGRFLVAITHYDLAMREKGVLRRVRGRDVAWKGVQINQGSGSSCCASCCCCWCCCRARIPWSAACCFSPGSLAIAADIK
jgi:hypothetical protein